MELELDFTEDIMMLKSESKYGTLENDDAYRVFTNQ